jgi:hypothetical protein
MESKRPRRVTGPFGSGWRDGPETTLGRQDLLDQDRPADQGVAALADTGLHRQVEIAGFVDEAADFASRLGDVQQQGAATSDSVICGHGRRVLLCPMGPARCSRVRPR